MAVLGGLQKTASWTSRAMSVLAEPVSQFLLPATSRQSKYLCTSRCIFMSPAWLGPGCGCSQFHVVSPAASLRTARPRQSGVERACVPAWGHLGLGTLVLCGMVHPVLEMEGRRQPRIGRSADSHSWSVTAVNTGCQPGQATDTCGTGGSQHCAI